MIRERDALFRQVRLFFFHPAVIELYRIENVRVAAPKPAERAVGKPREAGKFQDRIECSFGPFALEVFGPFELAEYPRGLARLAFGDEASIEGPLDATTWDQLANFVKQHHREDDDYGSSSERGSDPGCGGGGIPGWGTAG